MERLAGRTGCFGSLSRLRLDCRNAKEQLSLSTVTTLSEELPGMRGEIRLTRGGKKAYHSMVACYFLDLALVWKALRLACRADMRTALRHDQPLDQGAATRARLTAAPENP